MNITLIRQSCRDRAELVGIEGQIVLADDLCSKLEKARATVRENMNRNET